MLGWFKSRQKVVVSDLEIRSLFATDIDKGFVETLSSLSPVTLNEKEFSEILRERILSGVATIVCLHKGRIIGTAAYFVETKFLHNGGKVMHIEDVATHKEFQGFGVGKKLMTWLEVTARRENCYKIILDCSKDNVGFYGKCGYKFHEYEMRKDL